MFFLFFMGMFFYFDFFLFSFLCYIFIFFVLSDYSWSGTFLFYDSLLYVAMAFMCFVVLLIIFYLEDNYFLLLMSQFLVVLSVLFFFSSSFLSLYFFYELSLFPIILMILGFGSQVEKVSSSYYLLFYTVFCSFPFVFVYFMGSGFLFTSYFDVYMSVEFVFVLSVVFLVKFPVYFFHLWLPKAHVEAPTVASMILAGLLLKLGCVGFLRIMGTLNYFFCFFWVFLSFFGMVVCSLFCLMQSDVKSLAAYSSIVHMSMYLLTVMNFCILGKSSGVLVLMGHGFTSVLMFYFIGEFYHLVSSRMVYYFGGFYGSGFFLLLLVLVFLSNVGVPPTLSFFCEYGFVASFFVTYKIGFLLIGLYLFFSFYYSIYLVSNCFMGFNSFIFGTYSFCLCVVFCFLMFNLFWMIIIF